MTGNGPSPDNNDPPPSSFPRRIRDGYAHVAAHKNSDFICKVIIHSYCLEAAWQEHFNCPLNKFDTVKSLCYSGFESAFPFMHSTVRPKGNYPQILRDAFRVLSDEGIDIFMTDGKHKLIDKSTLQSIVDLMRYKGELQPELLNYLIVFYRKAIPIYVRDWKRNKGTFLGLSSLGLYDFGRGDALSNSRNYLYCSNWESPNGMPIMVGYHDFMVGVPVGLFSIWGRKRKVGLMAWRLMLNKEKLKEYQTTISAVKKAMRVPTFASRMVDSPYIFIGHIQGELAYDEKKGVNVCTFNDMFQDTDTDSRIEMWCDSNGDYPVGLSEPRNCELIAVGHLKLHEGRLVAKNNGFIMTRYLWGRAPLVS